VAGRIVDIELLHPLQGGGDYYCQDAGDCLNICRLLTMWYLVVLRALSMSEIVTIADTHHPIAVPRVHVTIGAGNIDPHDAYFLLLTGLLLPVCFIPPAIKKHIGGLTVSSMVAALLLYYP